MEELRGQSVSDLLKLHSGILEELRRRGVLRTENNPTGDFAEYLFCRAFGWEQQGNSAKGFDAVDRSNGVRYQIKGRRLHARNPSRQLSAIRDLDGFDFLAAVLLDANFVPVRAAIIPSEVVAVRSTYVRRTNSNKFLLHDDVWTDGSVDDVTQHLRSVLD